MLSDLRITGAAIVAMTYGDVHEICRDGAGGCTHTCSVLFSLHFCSLAGSRVIMTQTMVLGPWMVVLGHA